MTHAYRSVQWNRHKKRYDLLLVGGVVGFIAAYMAASMMTHDGEHALSGMILLIRGTAVCAFLMLHIILCIGPLARLSDRFAPLLYNRRHFGVTMFLVALVHAALVLLFYHGFGVVDPLVSPLVNGGEYLSFSRFPFQVLGVVALIILFFMAATSHDFWLKNLTPPVWKALHMGVYLAYGLLVMHVMLGAVVSERSRVYPVLVIAGAAVVAGLHIVAGLREGKNKEHQANEGWIDIGSPDDIEDTRAKVVPLSNGQSVAIFRDGEKLSAISNTCAHQNGPLGEGKIVDGCVTCPWHGYQYHAHNGQSPPPFTEKIATYKLRLTDGRVELNPEALPPGTPVEPLEVGTDISPAKEDAFYVGYLPVPGRHLRALRVILPALLLFAAAVAGVVGVSQRSPGSGEWETGKEGPWMGRVLLDPYPVIITEDGAELVVATTKRSARDRLSEYAGQDVMISAVKLEREGRKMLELMEAEDAIAPFAIKYEIDTTEQLLGERELVGEIIDPKCYLGAMKPGSGRTHKACAILCLKGGIPPMFVTHDAFGRPSYYLLTDAQGGPMPIEAIEKHVGERVRVTGQAVDWLEMTQLRVDPANIHFE